MDQARHILVGVAWPYANGEQHIGHIAGAYLPPDIFARFQRMCGNHVLMVSGSDAHGTPITVRAEAEGGSPAEIVDRFHATFIDSYLKLGLTFDLFTHTDTQNHWNVTQDIFRTHLGSGYIYKDSQQQLYDANASRFLPDRYVEGNCPFCDYDEARGDQCDQCGRTYEAVELKNPRSRITGNTTLEVRNTEHYFLDLSKLQEPLQVWLKDGKTHWRPNVIQFARSQVEQTELRGRPITRDMEWGVSIPLPNTTGKCIYVWYDAVIGYLSAAKEWAQLTDEAEHWRQWWDADINPQARIYNFIGKDNIPFHAMMWPAMLIACQRLNLPYDVPANLYLNMYGRKFSKSKGHTISILNVLERYQADAWRYALTAIAPEANDVDFTWDDFVERVNNELVANWGNLMKRLPTMKQLQYLVALADTQHFGRAAQRCYITQSTLSAGIRDLESVLGVAVAERSNRHVLITRTGIQIAEKAKALLREAEEVMEVARAGRSPMTGEMHLGVIPTISPFLLPRVLPVLKKRFPELTIYLREKQTATLLAQLKDGDLDVALIALPYETGDLGIDVIMEDEFLFACHQTHALAGAGEVSLEALAGEQLMLLEEGHCLRGQTLDVCGIGETKARTQFEASSLHTLVQMVAAGIGVTLIPRLAVDAHITQGTGISLSRLRVPAARKIGLAWRQTSLRTGEFRLLANTLRERTDMTQVI